MYLKIYIFSKVLPAAPGLKTSGLNSTILLPVSQFFFFFKKQKLKQGKMILQWARHNVADLNDLCPAFPPLYQWWKWMIIAERGLGLLPLAQSSQAITQPKCTYPKNPTRHLEPNPSSSHVSQPPPNINYYIFVWIKFSKAIQMRGNSKGRGLI